MALYGIGDATADKVLAARPIRSRSQLIAIDGVGETRAATIMAVYTLAVTINDAYEEELMQVEGIGQLTAARIVAARPITSQADLEALDQVGATQATALTLAFPIVGINDATAEELMRIDGVGEVLAGRIIDARPISSKADLTAIPQIGDARADALLVAFPILS